MKTPFTLDQFLEVFKNYNLTIFPLQILFYLLSILAVYLVIKPNLKSDKIISGILSFFWLWMGIIYHLIFFSAINKAAYLFGALFIFEGILLLIFGVFQNKLSFGFHPNKFGIGGLLFIFYALIVYPILGYFIGHVYPSSPTFGLPCPTTIFTFGLLLISVKNNPITILIIPFLWSVIGFTATFKFGIYEDTGLIVAGIIIFFMLLLQKRKLSHQEI